MGRNPEIKIWLVLTLLTLAALGLRLAVVFYLGVPDPVSYSESGMTAANLVQGRGYTFDLFGVRQEHPLRSFMPPLFPGLLALCLRYFPNPGQALGVIQSSLSALALIPFFFVAAWLAGDRRVAWLATLAAAGYPVTVMMSAFPPSMTLDLVMLTLCLWCVTRLAQTPTRGWAALAGISLGLAALGRPVMLGFVPCVFLWLALVGREIRRRLLELGFVLVAALVLILTPWAVRNYRVQGQFVLISTNGGFVFWNGNNPFTTGSGLEVYPDRLAAYLGQTPDPSQPAIVEMFPYPLPRTIETGAASLDEVELDRAHWQAGWAFIRSHPQRWAELALTKARSFGWFRPNIGVKYEPTWSEYYKLVYSVLVALMLPGLLLSWSRRRYFALLYLLILYHFVVYVAFHMQTRYRWVFEPYYLIFAALTLVWLLDRLPGRAANQAT